MDSTPLHFSGRFCVGDWHFSTHLYQPLVFTRKHIIKEGALNRNRKRLLITLVFLSLLSVFYPVNTFAGIEEYYYAYYLYHPTNCVPLSNLMTNEEFKYSDMAAYLDSSDVGTKTFNCRIDSILKRAGECFMGCDGSGGGEGWAVGEEFSLNWNNVWHVALRVRDNHPQYSIQASLCTTFSGEQTYIECGPPDSTAGIGVGVKDLILFPINQDPMHHGQNLFIQGLIPRKSEQPSYLYSYYAISSYN